MSKTFVSDTCALIEFFYETFRHFQVGRKVTDTLSREAKAVFQSAISDHNNSPIRLTLSSVTFIEIFEKWLTNDPDCRRFHYEVYLPIIESPNIEIRNLDIEVLENLSQIGDAEVGEHDKIVLATAITLNAPLITIDGDICDYVRKTKVIPRLLW